MIGLMMRGQSETIMDWNVIAPCGRSPASRRHGGRTLSRTDCLAALRNAPWYSRSSTRGCAAARVERTAFCSRHGIRLYGQRSADSHETGEGRGSDQAPFSCHHEITTPTNGVIGMTALPPRHRSQFGLVPEHIGSTPAPARRQSCPGSRRQSHQ
jgi:hypothetical protein